MRKLFLISLLISSSFLLFSCSISEKEETKKLLTSEKNTNTTFKNSDSKENSTPSLIIADSFITESPFILKDSVLYFPNWDDNEKISLAKVPTTNTRLNKDSVSEFFNYSASSMSLLQNNIFFSNKSESNKLYKLNLTNKEATLIANFPVKNLCNNGINLYFSNLNTGELYSHNPTDNLTTKLSSDRVGKFLINGSNILYQNASDNYKLYSLSTDGKVKVKLSDFSVDSFIPYNNSIYCINSADHNALYSIDSRTFTPRRLATINAQDLSRIDKTFLFIDRNDSNKLKTLELNFEKNTFKIETLLDFSINDYYLSEKGLFYKKSIDVNSSYYFLNIKK